MSYLFMTQRNTKETAKEAFLARLDKAIEENPGDAQTRDPVAEVGTMLIDMVDENDDTDVRVDVGVVFMPEGSDQTTRISAAISVELVRRLDN